MKHFSCLYPAQRLGATLESSCASVILIHPTKLHGNYFGSQGLDWFQIWYVVYYGMGKFWEWFWVLCHLLPVLWDFAIILLYGITKKIFITKILTPSGWIGFKFGLLIYIDWTYVVSSGLCPFELWNNRRHLLLCTFIYIEEITTFWNNGFFHLLSSVLICFLQNCHHLFKTCTNWNINFMD